MISGHGDDLYQWTGIKMNFSSNICLHADHSLLKHHLAKHLDLIAHYPEPEAWTLEGAIARRHGIDPETVLVTNGATDAIYLIAQAFSRLPYYVLQPTFSEYADACQMYGMKNTEGGVAWVCNPNNPTGQWRTLEEMRHEVGDYQYLVIDQAYEHYTTKPMLSPQEAISEGNILLLHSMTKTYAVPGLRLGYITANPAIVRLLRKHLRPWSVNALAIETGRFLIEHDELMVRPDFDETQRLLKRLNDNPLINVTPTMTNFMLCRHKTFKAAKLKELLAREYGMLIRDASNFQLDDHCFRIATQQPHENNALITALENLNVTCHA